MASNLSPWGYFFSSCLRALISHSGGGGWASGQCDEYLIGWYQGDLTAGGGDCPGTGGGAGSRPIWPGGKGAGAGACVIWGVELDGVEGGGMDLDGAAEALGARLFGTGVCEGVLRSLKSPLKTLLSLSRFTLSVTHKCAGSSVSSLKRREVLVS